MTNDPRFPVGPFQSRNELTPDERRAMIDEIAAAPARIREAVRGLTEEQLDTPYREGGWSVRQVVHHVPDSHLNAYVRTKLALTESGPTIKPYDEASWAELEDSRSTPPEVSLSLLEALHIRWVGLLRSLKEEDFARTFRHPDHGGTQTVDWLIALYSWHGRHHAAHITTLREREGW
jgi:uncharacterized damage-inducible protein DinB